MNAPGIYNLGSRTITAALTDQVITEGVSAAQAAQSFIDRLAGLSALTVHAKFVYGSGGTTCIVKVQTSINQGADWIDIARFDFATANAAKVANLTGSIAKAVTAVSALGAEGVSDAVLGDMLRAVVTSTGTYAGDTSVSVRVAAR